jgi:hypothetical protein
MLPAAQTKAHREEVVKTSQTIKPTISFQNISFSQLLIIFPLCMV